MVPRGDPGPEGGEMQKRITAGNSPCSQHVLTSKQAVTSVETIQDVAVALRIKPV